MPAPFRTERGVIKEHGGWSGTFGFIDLDSGGERVFVSDTTVGTCGLTVEQLPGARVEIDIAKTDRGLATTAIRLL